MSPVERPWISAGVSEVGQLDVSDREELLTRGGDREFSNLSLGAEGMQAHVWSIFATDHINVPRRLSYVLLRAAASETKDEGGRRGNDVEEVFQFNVYSELQL